MLVRHRTISSHILAPMIALGLAAGCATSSTPDTASADFEGFRASLPHEGFEGGVWIFDGDLPIDSDKRLQEVYAHHGLFDTGHWGPTERHQLRYCVSDAFGEDHGTVVAALEEAAAAWEETVDVDFHYIADQDGSCDASNSVVLFDVRPIERQPYMARAFFPHMSRAQRNLLVNLGALRQPGAPSMAKLLEHQLGHILGIDHTRIGTAVTLCDGEGTGGVMDNIECAGSDEPDSGHLTDGDIYEALQVYGAPSQGIRPAPPGELRHDITEGLLSSGAERALPPTAVTAGSRLFASLAGSGDLDLYVRFDDAPEAEAFDCRPYGPTSDEHCELEVPAGAHYAYVTVVNAAEMEETVLGVDDYTLAVDWVQPHTSVVQLRQMPVDFGL